MTSRCILALLVTLLASTGQSANILAMFPYPFYSHTMNFMPICRELANRGHNVTVVSPFPQKTPVANLTDIVIEDLSELFADMMPEEEMNDYMDSYLFKLTGVWSWGIATLPKLLQHKLIQRFIQDTESKFDLILSETWFIQEGLVAFGHKFNAPVINMMPSFLFPHAARLTGNQLPATYFAIPTKLAYSDRMSFLQRAENIFIYYWDVYLTDFYYLTKQDATMRKYFKYPGSENLPPLKEMLRNTSLTLIDYSATIGYPVPLHKNIIPYGGINVKTSEKLPEDLQKYMDTAKEGVIYFSFGSYFNVSILKPEVQHAIFSALGKLKQKILIKMEDSSVLERYPSKHIQVRKWFPQPSVLAHPNCKLFITHGGVHGTMESVYHAVPLLVVPLFADQKYNGKFVETTGIGMSLEKTAITEGKFLNAINTVINEPSYRKKMQERSAIFKDTPIDTLDNAVYWIEYVIRHRGAAHLRPAVLDLYWFQELMLDVILFYLAIIFLVLYILKTILKLLLRCIKCVLFGSKTCHKTNNKSKKE